MSFDTYVNHLTSKYAKDPGGSGTKLFYPEKAGRGKQHYTWWQTVMHSTLVRASVIRYNIKHNPAKEIAGK